MKQPFVPIIAGLACGLFGWFAMQPELRLVPDGYTAAPIGIGLIAIGAASFAIGVEAGIRAALRRRLRDRFAGQALGAISTHEKNICCIASEQDAGREALAEDSYRMADVMLAERDKKGAK